MCECKCKKVNNPCYYCSSELIWGGDNSFEDFNIEGEGMVTNLSCPNCGATAEFTTKIGDEN